MLIDGHNHIGADLFFYLNGFYPYAQDLPALVTEGRRHGVDRWIVFPMVATAWFELAAMRQGQLRPGGPEKIPYAFENERMLREVYELFPDLGRFTLPFAMLDPMREPAAQAARLRELHHEFPFYGLKIQATMIQADAGALLGAGRCFLELAEELNLPILMHSSVVATDPWSEAGLLLRIVAATPRVRFCLAHSCRFDRVYLDQIASLPNAWFDCSAHRIHCQGATRELGFVAAPARRFAADYRDPNAVLHALAEAYPTKLIWGSDTPFQSYVARENGAVMSLRSTYEEEIACLQSVPAPLRTQISHENTLAFLQVKSPAGILHS
ncbi:amidohydrolase family protein [Opitutus sp. ER46]|uniref:amidohydrolase family protein n=1 Tax=Opitutus sp. ER46 TaxID=2161864 RepID=UPI000D2FA167|nr:amidohydrolase family protein [Opitutus sp. ER46]